MVSDQKCMTRSSITIISFTVSQKINIICMQENPYNILLAKLMQANLYVILIGLHKKH